MAIKQQIKNGGLVGKINGNNQVINLHKLERVKSYPLNGELLLVEIPRTGDGAYANGVGKKSIVYVGDTRYLLIFYRLPENVGMLESITQIEGAIVDGDNVEATLQPNKVYGIPSNIKSFRID